MSTAMVFSRHSLLMSLPRRVYQKAVPHFVSSAGKKQPIVRSSIRTMATTRLAGEERTNALADLSSSKSTPFHWESDPSGRDAIVKTFEFVDFKQAWDWMGKVAILAEEMQHHPEWKNIYNMVEVTLTTHDCDGLSELDIRMAKSMDEYAVEILPKQNAD